MPTGSGGDDFVGIGGPGEGLWLLVVIEDEAIDGGLEIDDGAEDTTFQSTSAELAKNPSTALSQEHEVGVKWKTKRGWRSSQARTLGCL